MTYSQRERSLIAQVMIASSERDEALICLAERTQERDEARAVANEIISQAITLLKNSEEGCVWLNWRYPWLKP